jgi:hypothetical protein
VKRKYGKKANRKGSNTASRDLNPIRNKRKFVAFFFFLQRIPLQNFFRCSFPPQYCSVTQLTFLFLFDSVCFLYALQYGVHGMWTRRLKQWAGGYDMPYTFIILYCWSCRCCLPRPSTYHAVKYIRQYVAEFLRLRPRFDPRQSKGVCGGRIVLQFFPNTSFHRYSMFIHLSTMGYRPQFRHVLIQLTPS